MSSPVRAATEAEAEAIKAICDARTRLQRLGWQDAMYAPRNGEQFECIELGSTGIHEAVHFDQTEHSAWIDGDWPSRPLMIRRLTTRKPSQKR